MTDIEFNLIDEPWIKVSLFDGVVKEKSLMEVLENAHQYKGLAGEMTAQDIAVLRCLAAIVHTIFTRVDIEGRPSQVLEEKDSIERWKNIWEKGKFPKGPIKTYLSEWKDRFWLFHPDRPFYQVPKASIGTKNTVSKLNGAVSESKHKTRLFSQLSGVGKKVMSYAESVRWLLFINGFDDFALKNPDKSRGPLAWLGKLGLIYAIGDSLFETIMLNMPMLHGKDEILWEKDLPTWELDAVPDIERRIVEMPNNLAGLYTLQSRRTLLIRDNDYVSGYVLLGGDEIEDINALDEPMTLWKRLVDNQTGVTFLRPLLHERKRYIWQNFSTLTATSKFSETDMKPGIISWCDRLRKEKILSRKRLLIFGVVCVRYDSKLSMNITDSFADDVIFHADLLSEAGKYWREEIYNQIEKIDKAAYYLRLLVIDLRRADGLDPKKDGAPAEAVSQELYNEVDNNFREWLMKIDADQDAEERNIIALELESDVRSISLRIGSNIIEQAGEGSFIGRNVEIKKNVKKHYSAPEAYRWFKNNIWRLYPKMEGDEISE